MGFVLTPLSSCESCKQFYFSGACLDACPLGTFVKLVNSARVCSKCVAGCQCSGSVGCQACLPGYFASGSACVACESYCLLCTDQFICQKCAPGSYKYQDDCYSTCPSGNYGSNLLG